MAGSLLINLTGRIGDDRAAAAQQDVGDDVARRLAAARRGDQGKVFKGIVRAEPAVRGQDKAGVGA